MKQVLYYDSDSLVKILDCEDPRIGGTYLIKISNYASQCGVCDARFLIEACKVNFCPNCGRHVIKELEE